MVSAVPESHWHVKLGSHGNLKEREKTEEVGSLATVAGQLRRADECVGLMGLWFCLRRQRACVCCGERMSLAGFP